jgi:NitT/TauT family transport system substrate-binding protein
MPDAIALAGIGCGYFQQNLGPGTTLDAIAYSSSAAEAAAFAHGQLDAAYINPVAAVGAWQATRGQIRIIAGAASSADGTDTQYARTVLAVTTRLMAQSATLQKLLAGDIQAEILLATKPVTALHSLQAQLARVGKKTTARQLLTALAQLHVTSNPLASTIATEASRAATAGILRPIRDLADIYDLAALNALLKNVGQAPVSLDG